MRMRERAKATQSGVVSLLVFVRMYSPLYIRLGLLGCRAFCLPLAMPSSSGVLSSTPGLISATLHPPKPQQNILNIHISYVLKLSSNYQFTSLLTGLDSDHSDTSACSD